MPQEVKNVKFNDTIITKSTGTAYDYAIPGTLLLGGSDIDAGSGLVRIGEFSFHGNYWSEGVSRTTNGMEVTNARIGDFVFNNGEIINTGSGDVSFTTVIARGVRSPPDQNGRYKSINFSCGMIQLDNTMVNGDFVVYDGSANKRLVFNSDGSVTWVPFN